MLDQEVTVVRTPLSVTDRYNNRAAGAPRRTVYRGRLEDAGGTEDVGGSSRATTIREWLVFLPRDADVAASDILEVDGVSYEVISPPQQGRGHGRMTHVEIRARRIAG